MTVGQDSEQVATAQLRFGAMDPMGTNLSRDCVKDEIFLSFLFRRQCL